MTSAPARALRRGAAATAIAACLGACTIGPDYHPPRPDLPPSWRGDPAAPEAAASAAGTTLRTDWWRLFDDVELDAFVVEGLAANVDLAIAVARMDEARALLGVAASERSPAVDFDPSLARGGTSATVDNALRQLSTNTWRLPLDASWEIDFWGRVRRSVASAEALDAAARAAYGGQRLSVAAEIATTYLQARSFEREADALARTLALRDAARQLAKRRFDAGSVSELDVLRADAELLQAEADLDDVERRRALTLHALAVLLGRAAPSFELAPSPRPHAPPDVPAGLPAELLARRPDIVQAERQLASASEQIGIAQAAKLPTIRLTASGGVASRELSTLFEGRSAIWSLGPTLTLPLLDGGRIDANIAYAQARYREAESAWRKTVLVSMREVEDALSDGARLSSRARRLHRATAVSTQAATLSRQRYERGTAGYLEVIDAERTALVDERAEIQNEQSLLASRVALIKAIGGGWAGLEGGAP